MPLLKSVVLTLAVWAGFFCAPLAHAQNRAPDFAVYGAIPEIAAIDLSADGRSLVMLIPDGDVMTAQIADVGEGLPNRRVIHRPEDPAELIMAEWIDAEHVLIWEIASVPTPGGFPGAPDRIDMVRVMALHVPTGRSAPFLPDRTIDGWNIVSPQLLSRNGNRPGTVRIATYDSNVEALLYGDPNAKGPPPFVIYEVTLATGEGRIIERGNPDTRGWGADGQGRVRLRFDADPEANTQITLIRDREGAPYRPLVQWDTLIDAEWDFAGFDPNNDGRAFVAGRFGGDFHEIRAFDLAAGEIGETVFSRASEGYDVTGVWSENWTGEAVGFGWTGSHAQEVYFHPEWARVHARAEALFPNKILSFPVEALDRSAVVVRVSAPDDPPSYFHLDAATGQAQHLYDEYPALENTALGRVSYVRFPARDGTMLPGYLTLPAGGGDRNLPLIMMPHGGPFARDNGDFDWWAQFLASQGYAVFQPQFRGSTGYGKTFERAGWRQWGGLMQDDVSDAVGWLVAEGIADTARICIVGASYGGYAALAGATQTPELYRCVVSVAGVSDVGLMVEQDLMGLQTDPLTQDWLEATVAENLWDRPALRRMSPRFRAANVRAPILLLHGRDDTVVPYLQSEVMAQALTSADADFELIELPGEDHYLSATSTRTEMLRQLGIFLETHLGAAR
jgi:acetyl esterase/lipase